MANLRDVRLRMRAIEQTLKVTKAMKLISTAKLRKGRRMLENTEPYFKRIQKSMYDILSGCDVFTDEGIINSVFFRKIEPESHTAIIAITSDKGLAGSYNVNIYRKVIQLCENVRKPLLILIGAVAPRYFIHSPHVILEDFSFHSQIPAIEHAEEIADYVISQYLWGVFGEVHIVYTHMFNTAKLRPTDHQIIPLNKEIIQKDLLDIGDTRRVDLKFEYSPSAEEIFDALVPQYIKGVIYGCMVEAYASEQSARMVAMEEASKNADEMLSTLRINYNRERQAGITQEISEIAGSAESLAEN